MTKNFYMKKAEKLLEDIDLYRSSLDYYAGISECAELTLRQHREIMQRAKYLSRTVSAVDRALTLLNDTEYDVVTRLYFDKNMSFDDVCEACALERSSIYRYRASALKKIAKAIYGAE